MYLPRSQLSQLYEQLLKTTHPLSPPVLILTSLTVDSLCATRILTALLKRDYIAHKVQPVNGYSDLSRAGRELVLPLTRQHGGEGGLVVCLGVGGLVDLDEVLGLDGGEEGTDMTQHGVDVWVIDARRPWNLVNVFGTMTMLEKGDEDTSLRRTLGGVEQSRLLSSYTSGQGGIVVWDDGDIETELKAEREAYLALQDMPELTEEDLELAGGSDDEDGMESESGTGQSYRKRKASSQDSALEESDCERPQRRRRSNNGTPIPSSPRHEPTSAQSEPFDDPPSSSQPRSPGTIIPSSPPKEPSQRQLRRQLLKLRRKHQVTLERYYDLGTSYSEPVSSMLYSLASELGREDNDLLWLAIIGISSIQLSPYSQAARSSASSGRKILDRHEQIQEILRDEVRRLNPVPESELQKSQSVEGTIPTHGRSPTDNSIRLSPEPRFLLIRHWSLYESMLHSPYLSTRLHIWSDAGRKRLHKLLAKMGVSLQEAGKGYVHMDMELKRSLRERILKFAPQYNLDGLVPGTDGRSGKEGWGYVKSWGWKATLSASDVATIVGAMLEVGVDAHGILPASSFSNSGGNSSYSSRIQALPTPPQSDDDSNSAMNKVSDEGPDYTTHRFFTAYDALNPVVTSSTQGLSVLLAHIKTAKTLHRAILRTGSTLIGKKQIRHLRAFRMGVVKEGPDVPLFTHPGALVKLAGWVSEAVAVLEAERGRKTNHAAEGALVLACLDEARGVYVVVGLGGGGGGKKVRSKQEIKEREERKKRKEAAKIAKKAERKRKREERRRLQRERDEANGILHSDDENEDAYSDSTESASSSSSGSDDDSDVDDYVKQKRKERGYGLNRFGQAFQEVVEQTASRVRIDSFEHSVVEVRKEDLAGFLEALSLKSVIG